MDQKRVVYLDYLRLLATFGVILIHVFWKGFWTEPGSFVWYLNVTGDSLVRWAVPVFVMISGALFLNPDKEVTLHDILHKYIPRLALAYIIWWAVYSVVGMAGSWVASGHIDTKWLMPRSHLWFLPMMMCVYLLIPFTKMIAQDEKLLRYALIIWAVYITGSFVFFAEFEQITALFRLNMVLGYAGFFLLGRYLSVTSFDGKQQTLIYLLGLLGAAVGVGGNIGMSLFNGISIGLFLEYLSPHVILMSAAVFVFVKARADEWSQKTGHLVEYVRADLFGIYLVHVLWLMVLNQDWLRGSYLQILTLPVIAAAVFILSLYTTKILRKLPLIQKTVR